MQQNLYRSRKNKVLAGVCGGIAEYFNVDPTLIRLAWALAFFLGGTGLIFYILALIVMPENPNYETQNSYVEKVADNAQEGAFPAESAGQEGEGENPSPQFNKGNSNDDKRSRVFGIILIILGTTFLLQRFIHFHIDKWWPVILIALGIYLLSKEREGSGKK